MSAYPWGPRLPSSRHNSEAMMDGEERSRLDSLAGPHAMSRSRFSSVESSYYDDYEMTRRYSSMDSSNIHSRMMLSVQPYARQEDDDDNDGLLDRQMMRMRGSSLGYSMGNSMDLDLGAYAGGISLHVSAPQVAAPMGPPGHSQSGQNNASDRVGSLLSGGLSRWKPHQRRVRASPTMTYTGGSHPMQQSIVPSAPLSIVGSNPETASSTRQSSSNNNNNSTHQPSVPPAISQFHVRAQAQAAAPNAPQQSAQFMRPNATVLMPDYLLQPVSVSTLGGKSISNSNNSNVSLMSMYQQRMHARHQHLPQQPQEPPQQRHQQQSLQSSQHLQAHQQQQQKQQQQQQQVLQNTAKRHFKSFADVPQRLRSNATIVNLPAGANAPRWLQSRASACHRCKLARPLLKLAFCAGAHKPGARICRKKFCHTCLTQYGGVPRTHDWLCPACLGQCNCANCSRRKNNASN
ncbi:MAG: hypothetical protein MHM6MM_000026 [Cercozoa sp. M6MM]